MQRKVVWVPDFAELLVRARGLRGHTQEEAAEMLGTTRYAVSRWENGRGRPSKRKAPLLERYCGAQLVALEDR